jgi:hypothetical protein
VLRIEVLIGVIASAIAILSFMARAYANIRRGRRIKQYSQEMDVRTEAELKQLQEEISAAEEMSRRKRERRTGSD